jgi:restriction system protein
MTLPQWHGFVDPVLRTRSDGQIRRNAEIRTAVAERTRLSEEDMAEVMSSGEARWSNRINWAVFDAMKAGLLVREARGQYKISVEGLRRVSSTAEITYQTLLEYEPYRAYQNTSKAPKKSILPGGEPATAVSEAAVNADPSEALEQSADQLNRVVIDEIYRNLLELSPDAFERLIPFVVRALGYGTDREDNLKPTQRSGDRASTGLSGRTRSGSTGCTCRPSAIPRGTMSEPPRFRHSAGLWDSSAPPRAYSSPPRRSPPERVLSPETPPITR